MSESLDNERSRRPRLGSAILANLGLLAVYFLGGKLGLSLAFFHASASAVWPPTGIAIAALLLWGYQLWPAILVGAFFVNLTTQGTVATSTGIALGNTAEALLAAWLVRRFANGIKAFAKPQTVLRFVLLAGVLSTTVSATIGVSTLWLGRFAFAGHLGSIWLTWWLGNAVSAVMVAPLLLIWGTEGIPRFTRNEILEAFALMLMIIATGSVVFSSSNLPIGYLALLPLLWAAFRFRQRGTAAAAILTSAIALAATLRNLGPFAKPDTNQSLLLVQAFMGTISVTVLLLAAVVSERRQTQEALRFKEGELRLITEVTPLMLTRCSRDLRYVFVNRAYAAMLGRSPEEIVGKGIVDIMGPEGYETIRQHVETVLRGEPVAYETGVPFQGIGTRWLRVTYMPDCDDLGGVQGWVASIIDVTDRKQAEAASRRLTAIVESSDDAIIGKDLEDAVTSWNKAAERIFGYTAAEILGQPTTILYPPGLGHAAAGNLKEVSEGETIGQHEVVCRRKDGRLIDVSLTISPLKDAAGRVIGVSKIARDVTERKRAQEALEHAQAQLKAHADELEKTVLERTAELRERNAELEAFSYSLSHDLRAPLRTISNFTEFTLEDCRDKLGNHATNLERVLSASRRMDRLVIDVLAFTRVSWQEIKVETVDVESLVRAIINERPDFQAPAAEIEIKSPLPPIKGHPASLTQCVTNLLGNAVKFVAKDVVPRIVIRSEITAEIVRLWFEDNGVGIDKAAQPVIFDMFRRAHNKPQYEGSGLGLAIVRKAIERMGGKVGVESEPGKGSRFWIELPKG